MVEHVIESHGDHLHVIQQVGFDVEPCAHLTLRNSLAGTDDAQKRGFDPLPGEPDEDHYDNSGYEQSHQEELHGRFPQGAVKITEGHPDDERPQDFVVPAVSMACGSVARKLVEYGPAYKHMPLSGFVGVHCTVALRINYHVAPLIP